MLDTLNPNLNPTGPLDGPVELAGFNNHQLKLRAKARKEQIEQRLAKQKPLMKNDDRGQHQSSIADKVKHLNDMNVESLLGEILAMLLFHSMSAIFGLPYRMLNNEFIEAQRKGIAYQPDATGNYPQVFPIGDNGELDYNADPDTSGKASLQEIYKNGLIPQPTISNAIDLWVADLLTDLNGTKTLSPIQKQLLMRGVEQAKKRSEDPEEQDRLDLNLQQQAAMQRQLLQNKAMMPKK